MQSIPQQSRTGKISGVFSRHYLRWLRRRIPAAREVELNIQNIFIFPSWQGLGFLFVLALMFIGAINYESNLSFALVFWLLGMFILSIFHTYRNLAGLRLSAIAGNPVFAGENVELTLILRREGERQYEALELAFDGSRKVRADLVDVREQRLPMYLPSSKRGWFIPGRLRIETFFPFGICRAWTLLAFDVRCLVYPRPEPCDLDWLNRNQVHAGNIDISAGNEDFYTLREYQKGDPLKHVAWKNYARGQGMYTKQYSSNIDDKLWLSWDLFPDAGTEEKLSRLSWCVLQLYQSSLAYGLDIPGVRIEPARGQAHFAAVMQELALFGLERQQ